jgi:hypothetical protein
MTECTVKPVIEMIKWLPYLTILVIYNTIMMFFSLQESGGSCGIFSLLKKHMTCYIDIDKIVSITIELN